MKARIDPDELDLSQLKETIDSPGFRLIKQRLAETYGRELAKMSTVETWDNTRYLQGLLAGLTVAADVPRILESEIKARSAKKRKAANALDA